MVVARKPLVAEPIWKTVLVSTGFAALPSHAEPLGVDEPVADDDADGEAGAVEGFHAVADIGLEPWHQRLDVGLRVVRARRGSRRRQHQAKRHRSRQARHVGQEQEWSQRS